MNTEKYRGYTIKCGPHFEVVGECGITLWEVHKSRADAKRYIDRLVDRTDHAIEMARAAMSKPAATIEAKPQGESE